MYEVFLLIPMFMTLRLSHHTGETMADCELCGAIKVSVRQVTMGKAVVSACSRCIDKLGLAPKQVAPGVKIANSPTNSTSYSSKHRGKNIMLKNEKELTGNFASLISQARKKKGWNQATLGKRMAETITNPLKLH